MIRGEREAIHFYAEDHNKIINLVAIEIEIVAKRMEKPREN